MGLPFQKGFPKALNSLIIFWGEGGPKHKKQGKANKQKPPTKRPGAGVPGACQVCFSGVFPILPDVATEERSVRFIYFDLQRSFLIEPAASSLRVTRAWVFHMSHNSFRKWSRIHKSGGGGGEAGCQRPGAPGSLHSLRARDSASRGRGRPACARDGGPSESSGRGSRGVTGAAGGRARLGLRRVALQQAVWARPPPPPPAGASVQGRATASEPPGACVPSGHRARGSPLAGAPPPPRCSPAAS